VFFIVYVTLSTFVVGAIVSDILDKMFGKQLDGLGNSLSLQAATTREEVDKRKGLGRENDMEEIITDTLHSFAKVQSLGRLEKNMFFFMLSLVAGVLFFWLVPAEKKCFIDALYLSTITMSTVGFGDHGAISKGGRMFSVLWMICGFVATTKFISALQGILLGAKRSRKMAKLSHQLLQNMDVNGDGIVSRYEFLVYVLQTECLVSDDILKEVDDNFDALDNDGTGELSIEDVELYFQRRAFGKK